MFKIIKKDGKRVLQSNPFTKKVKIPNSITSIHKENDPDTLYISMDSAGPKEIILPKSVEYFGQNAFDTICKPFKRFGFLKVSFMMVSFLRFGLSRAFTHIHKRIFAVLLIGVVDLWKTLIIILFFREK